MVSTWTSISHSESVMCDQLMSGENKSQMTGGNIILADCMVQVHDDIRKWIISDLVGMEMAIGR